jgi:hypothetical protein
MALTGRPGVLSAQQSPGVTRIDGPAGTVSEVALVSFDENYVALPKLYGAPAYARPPATVVVTPRPFDPDQMPLEVFQTEEEEQAFAEHLPARTYASAGDQGDPRSGGSQPDGLRPRLFNLRAIAGRLLGGD